MKLREIVLAPITYLHNVDESVTSGQYLNPLGLLQFNLKEV